MGRQNEVELPLVELWEHVEANIRTLEAARRSPNAQLRNKYELLIKRGTCFVTYQSDFGIAFAPSRFIGYVGNDLEIRVKGRHGGATNRALARREILGRAPELDEATENAYCDFCRVLGFEPNEKGSVGNPRQYWMTNKVISVDESDAIAAAEEAAVADIRHDPDLSETEKEQIVKARYGQGRFRAELIELWGKCCMTGCAAVGLLRASHIKPWRMSDNRERLDKFNGLLLTPNADALFDRGYITFTDDGERLISKRLAKETERLLLADCSRTITVFEENKPYLRYHREHQFQR